MLAVAQLAHDFNLDFEYYSPPVSDRLRKSPSGNYKASLDLGTKFVEDNRNPEAIIKEYVPEDGTLVIPRGGFFADAELGVCLLAEELAAWMVENQIASEVAVVLPSGTGSTAYYLAKSLAALENTGKIPKTMVYTVSVAVSSEVLASDIKKLGGTELDSLVILDTQKKYRFGKPYPEFLVIYNTFREQQNIEFDLIYSPKTWKAIFENWKLFNDKLLVVVHTGGVTGNSSQLERYSRSSETKD